MISDTAINTRLENDCLLIEKTITRVETITLTNKDLERKFIGIWDPTIEGKAFIVRNDSRYQVVGSGWWMATWPSWEDDTILQVLRKFSPDCNFFIFDTAKELFKWLAE